MQDQILNLIAQFEQEAAQYADLARQAKRNADRGSYLDAISCFNERKRWVNTLQAAA
jgi:hypothetical protein